MMYHACNRPGMKPRQQRPMLIRESAEQTPRLTHCKERSVYARNGRLEISGAILLERYLTLQHEVTELWGRHGEEELDRWGQLTTAIGGKMMAKMPRKISVEHISIDM
jgi:hypothetical protein